MLQIRNLAGHPDPALAEKLLLFAEAAGPSIHALALHIAAIIADADDRSLATARNQRAVELARACGAALIEGFALTPLAIEEAAVHPAAGAARFLEIMEHYLRVGNVAHLRGFGRGIILPLVGCGAYEAAAVVDGATRTGASVLPTLTKPIEDAITGARDELGGKYDVAGLRGEQMADDELVEHVRQVVATLTN